MAETRYGLISESLEGKYFLKKKGLGPKVVLFKENILNREKSFLEAYDVCEEREVGIRLDWIQDYELISEKEALKEKKNHVSGHLEAIANSGSLDD